VRSLVWTVVGLAVALWSSIVWLVCRVIDVSGSMMADGVGALSLAPRAASVLSTMALAGTGFAGWLALALWLLVTLTLVAIGLFVDGSVPRNPRAA
jgi:hypothetical protein